MNLPRYTAIFLLVTGLSACSTTGGRLLEDLPLSDEPLLGKFVWHDLMTDDVEASREFYSGLFGWTYINGVGPGGRDYVIAMSGDTYVGGLVAVEDPNGVNQSRWMGYISVADAEQAAIRTGQAGGTVVVPTMALGNWGHAAAIQDPQGAVVGLIRSDAGDPDDSIEVSPGRVAWNELLASDDDAAASFYQSLAGFEVLTTRRRGGDYFVLKASGRERASILQHPLEDGSPTWLTYFAVTDPTASAARAESLGGEVLMAPRPDVRDGTIALVVDPTGALLALQKWPLEAGE